VANRPQASGHPAAFGLQVPPYGGDTLFTNLVTAYRHLSPALQALADGVWARRQFGGYNGDFDDENGDFDDETVYAQRPRRAARRGSSGGAGAARDRRARAVRESRIHKPHPGR